MIGETSGRREDHVTTTVDDVDRGIGLGGKEDSGARHTARPKTAQEILKDPQP
jgi:hypothetical protein